MVCLMESLIVMICDVEMKVKEVLQDLGIGSLLDFMANGRNERSMRFDSIELRAGASEASFSCFRKREPLIISIPSFVTLVDRE